MSSSHLAAPATVAALAGKIAAIRDALAANLLPDVAVHEEVQGRDHGFVVYGARVDEVERATRGLGVKVETVRGFTVAWFRAA